MPFDLNALERGYGEVDCDWNGHSILLRYRADLNNRALIAMKRVMVGVLALDGTTRFPDVEAIIDELLKVLLPLDHEEGPGWDLTDNGVPVPITFDTIVDLPPGMPAAMLGAIFRDVNSPDRRKPSRRGSSPEGVSQPIAHQTTTPSSSMPNGQASLPGPLPATPTAVVSGPVGASGYGP
jgi:hypothetical protein